NRVLDALVLERGLYGLDHFCFSHTRTVDSPPVARKLLKRRIDANLPTFDPGKKAVLRMADEAALGPISYLIVQFPGNKMTGEGFPALIDLVDRGLIRILDLLFVTRAEDGSMVRLELSDIDRDGTVDLAVFEGASSGMLDDSDLADAANVI